LQHDKGSGEALAAQYRDQGLNMLPERATFETAAMGSRQALRRCSIGCCQARWKVFDHLEDWFAEFRLYHRKDGLIVKLNDDLMSASRYALMMRRHSAAHSKRRLGNLTKQRTRVV
jgi:hypothetical protein